MTAHFTQTRSASDTPFEEGTFAMKTHSLTRRAFAAVAIMVAAGAFSARAETLPEKIRFGAFGAGFGQPYGVALLAIAQAKGFIADEFKDTPVKLEWNYLAGTGPAVNEAIANDQLDFAQYGFLPNIIGRANGLKTHVLMCYGNTTIFGAARKGLPIHSIKDLKGRRVTFQKGTILHWAFLKALEANGLTTKDVTVIDLKTADQLAALAAGSVDASIGSSSILSLRDQGLVDVFYTSKEAGPKATGFGGILATEQFETRYPEATQRVVRGLVRAAEWIGDEGHREEALQIWAKSGTPYGALKEEFDGAPLKQSFNPLIDAFLIEQYRDGVQFSKDEKLIRSDIDVNSWLEPKYLDAALKSLKLETYWPRRSASGAATN
jgi:sulfonate transport system substrate-binding protein